MGRKLTVPHYNSGLKAAATAQGNRNIPSRTQYLRNSRTFEDESVSSAWESQSVPTAADKERNEPLYGRASPRTT